MPSVWQNIEKTDSNRWLRVGVLVGLIWTAIGVVGCALVLAIGRTEKLDAGIVTAAIGLLTLLCVAVAGRARRRPSDQ